MLDLYWGTYLQFGIERRLMIDPGPWIFWKALLPKPDASLLVVQDSTLARWRQASDAAGGSARHFFQMLPCSPIKSGTHQEAIEGSHSFLISPPSLKNTFRFLNVVIK